MLGLKLIHVSKMGPRHLFYRDEMSQQGIPDMDTLLHPLEAVKRNY